MDICELLQFTDLLKEQKTSKGTEKGPVPFARTHWQTLMSVIVTAMGDSLLYCEIEGVLVKLQVRGTTVHYTQKIILFSILKGGVILSNHS